MHTQSTLRRSGRLAPSEGSPLQTTPRAGCKRPQEDTSDLNPMAPNKKSRPTPTRKVTCSLSKWFQRTNYDISATLKGIAEGKGESTTATICYQYTNTQLHRTPWTWAASCSHDFPPPRAFGCPSSVVSKLHLTRLFYKYSTTFF